MRVRLILGHAVSAQTYSSAMLALSLLLSLPSTPAAASESGGECDVTDDKLGPVTVKRVDPCTIGKWHGLIDHHGYHPQDWSKAEGEVSVRILENGTFRARFRYRVFGSSVGTVLRANGSERGCVSLKGAPIVKLPDGTLKRLLPERPEVELRNSPWTMEVSDYSRSTTASKREASRDASWVRKQDSFSIFHYSQPDSREAHSLLKTIHYLCDADTLKLQAPESAAPLALRRVGVAYEEDCKDLVSRARARFGIPPPGKGPDKSGHDILDGWWLKESQRGQPGRQRAGLVRGRSIVAEDFWEHFSASPGAREHVDQTLALFEEELGVSPESIDLPLVLAKGARESGVQRIVSRSNRTIVSSGREVHPDGRSGLDYLHNHRNDFPPSIRGDLRPVPKSELTKRGRERSATPAPARLPEQDLLAAFIVETRRAEEGFRQKVQTGLQGYSETERQQILEEMSVDATRAWSQLHFGLPGAVRALVRHLRDTTPDGELPDLDRLVADSSLVDPEFLSTVVRFGLRRARVTAAEAWLIAKHLGGCK